MAAITPSRKDETRNLNPHKAAVINMWIYGAEYAKQRGGSMDFWDNSTEARKHYCRELLKRLKEAPEERP